MDTRIKCLVALLALAVLLAGCGPERYYNKGEERFREGEYDKAIQEYLKAIEKDSDGEFPDASDKVVECYLKKSERHYDTNIHDALIECENAVAEAKRLTVRPDTLRRANDALLRAKNERDRRVAEAARLLDEARKAIDGKSDLSDYTLAQSSLERALKLDPHNSEVSRELANVRRTITDINRANDLAARGDSLIATNAGLTLRGIEEAQSYYNQALQVFPKCAKAKDGLGRIEALVKEVKTRAEAEYQSALAFEKARNWKASLEKLNECIRLDYKHERARALQPKISALVLAEKEYNNLVAQVENRKRTGIRSVGVADELVALCDRAIRVYEYNDKAAALKQAVLTERASLLREAEAHFDRGKTQLAQKQYEASRDSFRKCLELHPRHTEASIKLAEVNAIIENLASARVYVREGDEFMRQGKPYEAKDTYNKALGLVKDLPEAQAGLKSAGEMIERYKAEARAAAEQAEIYYNRKQYEEALKKIDEAILKDPNNRTYPTRRKAIATNLATRHYNLGRQYEIERNWDKAAEEYKIAESYDEKFKVDYERVMNEKAADRFAAAAEDKYAPVKDWYNAAICYKKAADMSESRKSDFNKLRDDMLEQMMLESADCEKDGKYSEALELLDKIVEVSPTYRNAKSRADVIRRNLTKAETAYSTATGHIRAKKYAAAREELRRLERILPNYKDTQALIAEAEEKYKTAQESFEMAQRFESGERKLYDLALGAYRNCLNACADFPGAAKNIEDLETAAAEYKNGEQFFRNKKLVEAAAAFRKVARLRSDYADVKDYLIKVGDALYEVKFKYDEGVAYQNNKEWAKALDCYNRVLELIDEYKDTAQRLVECQKQLGVGG